MNWYVNMMKGFWQEFSIRTPNRIIPYEKWNAGLTATGCAGLKEV